MEIITATDCDPVRLSRIFLTANHAKYAKKGRHVQPRRNTENAERKSQNWQGNPESIRGRNAEKSLQTYSANHSSAESSQLGLCDPCVLLRPSRRPLQSFSCISRGSWLRMLLFVIISWTTYMRTLFNNQISFLIIFAENGAFRRKQHLMQLNRR